MAANKIDVRQTMNRAALPMVGSATNETLDLILGKIDPELSKLFEDRNLLLTGGGTITNNSTGTSVTFSANFVLYVNQNVAGAAPYAITLGTGNSPLSFASDGNMAYIVINRTAQTATFTGNASSLPAASSANQEVVMIAKRVGTSIYFMGGFVLPASGTMTLGRGGSVIDTEFLINDSSDGTKQIAFDAGGTTGTKSTIVASQTASRSLTLPDATTTLVGTDVAQTLSSKILEYSSADDSASTGSSVTVASLTSGIVRLTNASLVSVAGIPSGAAGRILIVENKTGNQITINNEDTGATAANRVLTGSGANVSMPNNATFMFTYDSTASRWQLTGGSGSGSGSGGSKNYLSAVITSQSTSPNTGNGNFEAGSTSGWSLFNTTLTSLIPTGSITAGAASITTFNTVSSSQLAGSYSLQTASSAAWSAGQGFISDAFYIDNEDQNKILTFKAYYKAVANPSNGNFSGTSSNTFAIYIYDVTNSAWIQPAGVYGLNQNSGIGYVTGTFQTTSNSTQYRIAVLAINASSGAITMYWDDFSVGPQTSPIGAAVSDWVPYTATVAGFGTISSSNFEWRRVGDSVQVKGRFTSGTSTATAATISLPNGIIVDSTKVPNQEELGEWHSNSTATSGFLFVSPGGNTMNMSIGTGLNNNLGNAIAASGGTVVFASFSIPISGWSSNVVMSNDTDTRVISAFYNGQPTGTLAGSDNLITIPTKVIDTSASMSSGTYTVPVAGKYSVTAQIGLNTTSATANQYFTLSIKQNGTLRAENVIRAEASSIDSRNAQVHAELDCSAGDTITLTSNTNMTSVTYNSTVARSYVKIERLSGPATIAATETVTASYTTAAGQSISNSTADIINFDTKDFDTHGAVTTGASWKFTAPISGFYNVSSVILFASSAATQGNAIDLQVFKNGSVYKRMSYKTIESTFTNFIGTQGQASVTLNAGDYIDIRVSYNRTGGNTSLHNSSTYNHVEISRIK